MKTRLADLDYHALAQADPALLHIAETAQLSAAQRARITERTLDKAGIAQRPARTKKRRIRLLGAVAAAAAVLIAGIGVSGRLLYRREFAEKQFGALGTAYLEESLLTAPASYTNGTVSAEVQAVLCDGQYALVLAVFTCDSKPDWYLELAPETADGAALCMQQYRDYGKEAWVSWLIAADGADEAVLTFPRSDNLVANVPPEHRRDPDYYDDPHLIGMTEAYRNSMTEGLTVRVPFTQNIPVVTMTADSGETIRLSGFQIYSSDVQLLRQRSLVLTDTDGIQHDCVLEPHVRNTPAGEGEADNALRIYEVQEGAAFRANDPTTYSGFLDVERVASLELNGKVFRAASAQSEE